jgi:intracellular sulfur oxidation DsrE/DsrF family protein
MTTMFDAATARRGFLERAAAALVGFVATPSLAKAQQQQGVFQDTWLQGLAGKHKQIADVGTLNGGTPLARTVNFLDAYGEYGMNDSDLNVVFGVHGSALGFTFNDTLWAKYELGKRWNETDPRGAAPASRNIFAGGAPTSVTTLQGRGVRFIACMRAIRRFSGVLATPGNPADKVREEILANLLPGVTPVPALIIAVNRAQEAGFSYVFLG